MQSFKSFDDVHRALTAFVSPTWPAGKRYTLERMRALMDHLGNPQDSLKVIHIAGTSGKTSTAYFLSAQLVQSGKRVGTTISPHVDEVNERVQINLEPLPDKKFFSELTEFLTLVKKSKLQPSYFELLVAFAYWEFAKLNVDYAVVEVGLGGLLDGTNVINRQDKVCVITDIGMDHTAVLGNDITSIAAQKAGIITDHNTVFCLEQSPEVMNVIKAACIQHHAILHAGAFTADKHTSTIPLFQQRNWKLSQDVFDYLCTRDSLSVLTQAQLLAAQNVHIPARMEQIELPDGRVLIIDGAHNPQKLHAFAQSVRQLYPDTEVAGLFGLISGKDAQQTDSVQEITGIAHHVIFTGFQAEQDMPRPSIDPQELLKDAKQLGFTDSQVIENPKKAYESLLKRSEQVLIVTGSFYLLNHVRPLIFKS